jgi:hypothetical protein
MEEHLGSIQEVSVNALEDELALLFNLAVLDPALKVLWLDPPRPT